MLCRLVEVINCKLHPKTVPAFTPNEVPDLDIESLGRRPSTLLLRFEVAVPPIQGLPRSPGGWDSRVPFVVRTQVLFPNEGDGLTLKSPIDVETSQVDGIVQWRLPEFDLTAEGADDARAEAALLEQLLLLKETYVTESDEDLTPGAQELKKRLLETIG